MQSLNCLFFGHRLSDGGSSSSADVVSSFASQSAQVSVTSQHVIFSAAKVTVL